MKYRLKGRCQMCNCPNTNDLYHWEHFVSFKFNEKSTNEQEEHLLQILLSFRKTIPGIISLTAGFNETKESDRIQGFRLGLRITFKDRQALDAYATNPEHLFFINQLTPIFDNAIVVDYPIKR
ncbi:Dabb family protein [Bacillus sp. FSL R12-0069]|uniref:Dabb family protein n=1 Tax=Bacillus sp. FSL R12-0069 TaxID=2975342 RepID=UPI0030F9E5C1